MGSLLSCMSRQRTNKQSSSTRQKCADTDTSQPLDFSSLSCKSEPVEEKANTQSYSRVAAFNTQKPVDIDTSDPPDFSIIVEEETIPVHRNLLEETCDYFHCLFECRIQEVQTGTLEVKHMKASVVRTVISYLYGENISIAWDNVTDYVDIAEMWQLLKLKDELEDYLVTNIIDADINNCIPWHWVDVAENCHMEKLERKVQNLDARTKLCVCISSIDNDNASESKYVNLLYCFKLTKCTPGFTEILLKNTLTDAELVEVQLYADMLQQMCTENTLETKNEEHTPDFHVSAGNRYEAGKERRTMSSKSTDKQQEGMCYSHGSQNSRGEHKIIALRSDQMLYSFDFSRDLSEVHVTETGRHPQGNAYNCMTPYGMFSMQGFLNLGSDEYMYDCILFEISLLNYIRLPELTIFPRLHPVCMNATVYVLNLSLGKVACLDLQKPTHWHITHDVYWGHSKFCSDAYAIGSKIYLTDIIDNHKIQMACYDTTNQTQSKCKTYNPRDYKNMKVVATEQSILVLYTKEDESFKYGAKYNATDDQWAPLVTLDFTDTDTSIHNTEICYLHGMLGVYGCLIVAISSVGKLFVYDVYHRKPIRSLEIPWDSKYEITNIWNAR